jgi:transcription elongation factor Elf1
MTALVRPIPFSKGNSDFLAVRNMVSVIKQGGCVCMFPSGNRSFFGEESSIPHSVGKLAKLLKAPLVLVQIRGGYNTKARWSAKINKGKMTAAVVRVIQSRELAAMSGEEVDRVIQKEIFFNEFEFNDRAQIVYRGRRKAEYLESVLFYCPECNSMTGLCSKGSEFFCRDCGARVRINSTGFFERIDKMNNKADNIPGTILEWSRKQLDYIKGFDFSGFTDKPVFCDYVSLSRAERAKKETDLGKGLIELYADKLRVCGHEFCYSKTTTAIHGVRKMSIYYGDDVYAVTAPQRINLVKYMICGYHLRNLFLNTEEEYYGY